MQTHVPGGAAPPGAGLAPRLNASASELRRPLLALHATRPNGQPDTRKHVVQRKKTSREMQAMWSRQLFKAPPPPPVTLADDWLENEMKAMSDEQYAAPRASWPSDGNGDADRNGNGAAPAESSPMSVLGDLGFMRTTDRSEPSSAWEKAIAWLTRSAAASYIFGVVKFMSVGVAAGFLAWSFQPGLEDVTEDFWHLSVTKTGVAAFESTYLSFISLAYALMIGNTFAFLYNRQQIVMMEAYNEIFALELLIQEAFLEVEEPALRWAIIGQMREYLEDFTQTMTLSGSPFEERSPVLKLLRMLPLFRGQGKDITGMLVSLQRLAEAQSARMGAAAAIFPPIHFAILWAVGLAYCGSFLVFEVAAPDESISERRLVFGFLVGLCSGLLFIIQDLNQPMGGIYSFRGSLEKRLSFVKEQLTNLLDEAPVPVELLRPEKSAEESSDDEDDDSLDEGGAKRIALKFPSDGV